MWISRSIHAAKLVYLSPYPLALSPHTKSPLSGDGERGLGVRSVLPPGVLRRLQDGSLRQHLRQMRAEVR